MGFLHTAVTSLVILSGIAFGQSGPILDLGYAKYQGFYNASSDVNNWNGIHFAQAPVGALRWMPPVDIEKNNNYSSMGVMNATAFGPTCIQGQPFWQAANASSIVYPPTGAEDCLLLDIQVPAHPQSSSLPILLQIHGGGYTQGNADTSPADGLLQQSNGSFVYVTVQYRLGVYGFLSSLEVRQNGVANAGLLDQRAAILWTQRNAKAFGGDPSKITIIGGSAGGGSVMSQMILYGGEASPPFRGVISQYPWWQPFKNDSTLETQYRLLLQETGCSSLTCLRGLDTVALANATQKVYVDAYAAGQYGYGDYFFGPSVDGDIIRDLPSNEFKNGHFTKVALLVNRDGYEGVLFSNRSMNGTDQEITDLHHLFPYAKQSFINRLYELYPVDAYNSTFFHRAQWYGDFIIECPSAYMAAAVADLGLPSWKLLFYAGSELHGATSPYLYAENNNGTQGANNTIGAYMKDWFISFTTHLDPNAVSYSGLQKPFWPTYNNGSAQTMVVNYTQIGVVHDYDDSPQCDFFHGQSYVVRN
ncbi:alpha/beta-hydrolase [Calocera cornea HHB12733]|uniref:Carboxylic ester hydrolase n=1 Tax=Calocera cornea HHB12733 TaxID=1353952 RepID=A0A165EQK7_9BASI|nr:alpha/beta-hydrolase [Calocera cornea HHB12733]